MAVVINKGLEKLIGEESSSEEFYAVYMLDADGIITSWEPGAKKMKGYTASEVIGKHCSIFYAEGDQEIIRNGLREARSCGKHTHEGWRVRKNNTKFYAHVTVIPLVDPTGKHFGFANITRDLTSQRDALERLKRKVSDYSQSATMNEQRVRIITDTLPSIISEFDSNLNFRFANSACLNWFGKSEKELIGTNLKSHLTEQNYRDALPHLKSALEGRSVGFEGEYISHDVVRTYLVNYVPEFDNNNNVNGVISFATDVTQLKQARIAAESANNAKSSFLANMAHEIRTPLGAVLGFSELLLKENVSAQDRKIYQSAIARNGSLLSNIINDVLDFAKIEAGMLHLDRREVGLQEILNDTISTLELHAKAKKIHIKPIIDFEAPRTLYTDPSRLKQVLLNIVGNAIKFTNQGTVKIKVEPLDPTQHGVRFVIEDSGIGISADQAAKLFMPFKQSEDFSRRRFGGTGLGLALSRQMAQLLGGDVQLTKTELGKGSTFTITINSIAKPKEAQDSLREQKIVNGLDHLEANGKIDLSDTKILLVEDSPDNQILVSRILENAGANGIVYAQNGVEALIQSANNKFDVILMDLQMPIMDGYEAATELRRRGDETPIVALTAHAMREEHDRCIAVGINAHLAKPIDNQLLVSTVIEQRRHSVVH